MANLSDIITPTNVLTDSNTKTVTNKTINGSNNTVTNVALTTGVTGTLPVAKGGTNLTALGSAGQVLTVNSGASALEYTTPTTEIPSQSGNSGKFLTTNGTAAAWDAVDVSSEITGTLPVANGGTGAATLTANNVLLGNGTSAPLAVAPSTSGNVLTSNGTTWQSTAPSGSQIWTFIDRYDVTSGANTHDFTGDFSATYNDYWIKLIDWYHGSTGAVGSIDFQFYRNGTLKTSGLYNSNGISSTGGDGSTANGRHKATQTAQFLTYGQVRSDPTDDSFNGNLFIYNANSNRISYNFTGGSFSDDTNVAQFASYNGYHNESGTTLTGIRIMDRTSTGTTTVAGRIEIYGGTIQS